MDWCACVCARACVIARAHFMVGVTFQIHPKGITVYEARPQVYWHIWNKFYCKFLGS